MRAVGQRAALCIALFLPVATPFLAPWHTALCGTPPRERPCAVGRPLLQQHSIQTQQQRRAPPPALLYSATGSKAALSKPRSSWPAVTTVALLFSCCTLFSLCTDMLTRRILQGHSRPGLAITVTFFHFFASAVGGAVALPLLALWQRSPEEATPSRAGAATAGAGTARSKSAAAATPRIIEARSAAAAGSRGGASRLSGVGVSRGELLRMVWPLALLQLLGFLSTNLSLKFAPVSFSHTVKACECLFTAAFVYLVLGQTLNWRAYAALVPTAGGVALSAASELHFSLAAFAAAMSSNVCFAARSVLSTRVLRTRAVSAATLYWMLCVGAAAALAPAFLLGGQPTLLLAADALPLLGALSLCGLCHFSYNLLSFEILTRTSPVTHVVLHALRRIIVIGASAAIVGQAISPLNWFGIAVAFVGVLGYALAQAPPKPREA